jgi:two-component system NtrC family sensor kinase
MKGKLVADGVGASRERATLSVLVVDDEPAIASLLADLLEMDGYRVATARTGLAALDRLRDGGFDAIVSDIRMPELDGPGLYRRVEQLDAGLARRMVFVTGNAFTDDTADFFSATGAPCIRKPFARGDLQRALQHVLAQAP